MREFSRADDRLELADITCSNGTMIPSASNRIGLVGLGVLALVFSACSGPATPAESVKSSTPASNAATPDASATPAESGSPSPSASDTTEIALKAIATAEGAAGGKAYAIDDVDDDGTWEVNVMVNEKSVEYDVSGDGAKVVSQDEADDMDDDERTALTTAKVPLAEAIETAAAEGAAPLDDAELDDESGNWAWEISLQGRAKDVIVDLTTGQVLSS